MRKEKVKERPGLLSMDINQAYQDKKAIKIEK